MAPYINCCIINIIIITVTDVTILLLTATRRWPLDRVIAFLSRVRTLTRDIDIAILSVCPSVCLSVRDTLVLYENVIVFHHTVVRSFCFTSIKYIQEIPTGSPPAGALNTDGV